MQEPTWTENLMLIVAGGQAGLLEMIAVYPLDVLRTRLKWKSACDRITMRECLIRIYKEEGFLSYWKGLTPHLIANTTKKTLKLVSFQKCKNFLSKKPVFQDHRIMTYMVAGSIAGTAEATFICPFEIVKVSQQLNFSKFRHAPTTLDTVRHIFNKLGVRGFYRGLDAMIVQHSVFNLMYFSFYHGVIKYLPKPNAAIEFLSQAAVAFLASIIPATILTPIDVARIQIQGPQQEDKKGRPIVKYQSVFQTLRTILKEEGYQMLYRGLPARIIRSGSSGTVLMLVFEYGYNYLQNTVGSRHLPKEDES